MEFESNPVGMFSLGHFIYLFMSILIIVLVSIFVKKKITKKNTQDLFLRILSALILVIMLTYRIYIAISYILVDHNPEYNWWIILPNGLCGVTCIAISIATLIKPRNNITYHCFLYLVIFGTILTLVYPISYYKNYSFFHPYCFLGMLYHALSLLLCILLITTKSFKPDLKKWWVMPIGYALIIMFGFIQLYLMGIPESMNIVSPLVPAIPRLSSWYGIGITATIVTFLFLFIYDKLKNSK